MCIIVVCTNITTRMAELENKTHKECSDCKEIKPIDDFRDPKLKNGFGRICKKCKASKPKSKWRGGKRRARRARY